MIVGASSEIGTAIALSFARARCDVHLWGRDADRLDKAAAACVSAGAASTTVRVVDVRDGPMLRNAIREVTAERDVTDVVWAAGVFQWGPVQDADEGVLDNVLETVFTGAVIAARAFAPALIANAPSSLIFIGSSAGQHAFENNAAYVAAKHGLRGLAGALHLDLCDAGVKVSVISAGLVNAGAGRLAPAAATSAHLLLQPEDIARSVEFITQSSLSACPIEIVLRPATRHV